METLSLGMMAGAVVGLVLGLTGGGGSILAVPMLIYVVGVTSPHVAIGTSAVAVAAVNLVLHARQGTVKWRCAILFALVGATGAWVGAALGKATNGQNLLALFGAVMITVGLLMLRRRSEGDNPDVRLDMQSIAILGPRLVATGAATGFASGYFGIGGGFLIVPSLLFATNMPMMAAVGSSLLAVAAFGATTAISYGSSGLVDWALAGVFVAGGVLGGAIGSRLAKVVGRHHRMLTVSFGVFVAGVGTYVLLHGLPALIHRLGS
jgi:uncharacterized membrane protein YfcA